ncbi:MAG: CDP-6-deoxy-delta-3,4-glucoseen reductase [Gammaproteobacteria bacterium]
MAFKVYASPSGHEFEVAPDETILQAALREGYGFPYGCRNGTCGSCKGKLLEGQIDYGNCETKGLNETDSAAGFALLCQAKPVTDVKIEVREISRASGIVVKMLPCRVAKLEQLTHDVVRVYLKLPASERLQFFAGQYLDILLRDGRRRSFSIANPPHDDEFIELHIRQIEGGRFTGDMSNLKEKAILRIQGPLGNFYLREDSERPIILMAGGTGFGPIKGIIEHALAEKLTRPMHLYRGARAQHDLYLDELARSWAEQHENFSYTPVLSQLKAEDEWQGRRGYVPRAVLQDYPDLTDYEVYASGPPAMVHEGHIAFTAHGLSAENFYADPFEFAQDAVPTSPA